MVNERIIWETIKANSAIIEGHFFYPNEFHSQYFIDTNILFQYPSFVETVVEGLDEKLHLEDIDYVVTPNYQGGHILAHYFADRYNAEVKLFNRKDGIIRFPPRLNIKGDILIVDDGINTGNSLIQLLRITRDPNVSIKGIGVLINRYPGDLENDFKGLAKYILSLTKEPYNLIDLRKKDCHLCSEYNKLKSMMNSELARDIRETLQGKLNELEIRPIYSDLG